MINRIKTSQKCTYIQVNVIVIVNAKKSGYSAKPAVLIGIMLMNAFFILFPHKTSI